MAFSRDFLEELETRNDIVDVVGSYVSLVTKSGSHWGCCPFHNEKTPSFHVLKDKQMYHCFGCKKGGGVINFIMDVENLPFPDAVAFLAKRAGMEMPVTSNAERDNARKRSRMLELNKEAARFFYQTLHSPQGQTALDYMNRRQISPTIARRFGLGAAPDRWDSLLMAMTAKGYSKADLLDAGLIVKNQKGGFYDKFRNRLMFPVIDIRGDVVAFGGRVLGDGEPKYMNSSETLVYSKRRTMYGLNLAKTTKRTNMILCEGNVDVVMLHHAGFDNAVATMGTAMTQEQVKMLSRYTKELILCYDNDSAGQKATDRALEMLGNSEFTVRVLNLPRRKLDTGELVKQDPDDFIKFQGADAFERLLSGSEHGMEFRLSQTAAQFDLGTDQGRLEYSTAVAQLLSTIVSPVEREIYTVRGAEMAKITPEALRLEVERYRKQSYRKDQREQRRRDLNPATALQSPVRSLRYEHLRSALAEEGVLRLILLDQTLLDKDFPLTGKDCSSALLGQVLDQFISAHRQGFTLTLTALSARFTSEEMSHITNLCQRPELMQNAQTAMADYIRIIHEEQRKRNATEEIDPLLAVTEKYKNKKEGP
ncbi:DNA primase [Bengtsoniella intestinalis]|uniref:DNA primase n=1 Tax=Bengtsoniella intestinalis TaxID=3073143 RepID=UPI00391FA18B